MDGVVTDVGRDLAQLLELRFEAERRMQPLELFQAMGQLDHVGLGAACALPRDVAVGEHGHRDREKRRREDPSEAGRAARVLGRSRGWLTHTSFY